MSIAADQEMRPDAGRDAVTPANPQRQGGHVLPLALGLIGLLLLVVLWWVGTDLLAGERSFARRFSPSMALPALWTLATEPDLWIHIHASLKRVLVGLGIALAVGVPLGLLVGSSRLAEAATTPAFQFLRMISPLSWMPIAVMVFGVGDAPIYFLLAFAAIWPILLNTAAAFDNSTRIGCFWLKVSRRRAGRRFSGSFCPAFSAMC